MFKEYLDYHLRKSLFIIILVPFLSIILFSKKLCDIPELTKYGSLLVTEKNIVIVDQFKKTLHFYNKDDLRHIKQVGREGEGPGEFKRIYTAFIKDNLIYIGGMTKTALFSENGQLIKEIKFSNHLFHVLPFGNLFTARKLQLREQRSGYDSVVVLLDKNFKMIKKITGNYELKSKSFDKKNIYLLSHTWDYNIDQDKLIVGNTSRGFYFDIYNERGEKTKNISIKYKKEKVSPKQKKIIYNRFKNFLGNSWNGIKRKIIIHDYFPSYEFFKAVDNKIYVFKHIINFSRKVIILNLSGSILKETKVSDKVSNMNYFIVNNLIYYLWENPISEEWELHREKI